MKRYILAIVGSMLFFSSASAFAAEVGAAGYGEAGCGLGALIFGKQKGGVQILAATTNNTFYNQAFGISSWTSNCDAKGWDTAKLEQEQFVANNFSGLAKEMASGEGEQLTTLAGLLGCPATQQPRFNTVAQRNYETILASDRTTPSEMLTAVKAVMSSYAELSAACAN
jgi:hypothetical protein